MRLKIIILRQKNQDYEIKIHNCEIQVLRLFCILLL